MQPPRHLAHFYRYLWEDAGLLVVLGDSRVLAQGRLEYNARYKIAEPSSEQAANLERLMGAAGLAAVSLADREFWGWTVNVPRRDYGLFCAIDPEGSVSAGTRAAQKSIAAAVVQRQKLAEKMKTSHFDLVETDPVSAVNAYFEQAEQLATRVEVGLEGRCALAQRLPDGDFSKVKELDREAFLDTLFKAEQEGWKPMGEVLLFYECRCSEQQILEMLTQLPADRKEEIWKDEAKLEIECPRCGREYVVERPNN